MKCIYIYIIVCLSVYMWIYVTTLICSWIIFLIFVNYRSVLIQLPETWHDQGAWYDDPSQISTDARITIKSATQIDLVFWEHSTWNDRILKVDDLEAINLGISILCIYIALPHSNTNTNTFYDNWLWPFTFKYAAYDFMISARGVYFSAIYNQRLQHKHTNYRVT